MINNFHVLLLQRATERATVLLCKCSDIATLKRWLESNELVLNQK